MPIELAESDEAERMPAVYAPAAALGVRAINNIQVSARADRTVVISALEECIRPKISSAFLGVDFGSLFDTTAVTVVCTDNQPQTVLIDRMADDGCADWFTTSKPDEPAGPSELMRMRPMPNAWGR